MKHNLAPTRVPALRAYFIRSAAIGFCVIALAGCNTVKGWFGDDDDKAVAPVELVEFQQTQPIARLWTASAGKGEGLLGARQRPVIADGRVYAAAVEGGVRAFDLVSGASAWVYGSDLRIAGGPGVGQGVVAVGSLEGDVVALDAASGAELWRAKVPNEMISAPAIGMDMVFVRSNDGRVTALDLATGERRWFWNRDVPSLSVRGNSAPVLGPGFVFVGNDDGTVVALSASDGRPLWEQAVGQQEGRTELDRMADVDGAPVLDGTTLFATSFTGETLAINAPSGQPMWLSEHGGPGRIGAAPSRLVVSAPDGTVYGLDRNTGSAMWSQPGLLRRSASAPAIHGDYAVVGDFEGYLHWMRLDNGEFAARVRTGRDPVRGVPAVSGDILVAQDIDGGLSAYRLGQ